VDEQRDGVEAPTSKRTKEKLRRAKGDHSRFADILANKTPQGKSKITRAGARRRTRHERSIFWGST